MSELQVGHWKKLKSIPDRAYGIPIYLKNELIVPLRDALMTYDAEKNKWAETFKYYLAYDKRPNVLTIQFKNDRLFYVNKAKLMNINLETNTSQQISNLNKHYELSLFVGDNLHLFLLNIERDKSLPADHRSECPKVKRFYHLIYNIKTDNYTQVNASGINVPYGN